jgi:hypothetical protein
MQQSALRRLLGLLGLLRFLGRPPCRRSCRSHPWISRRDSSPRRRRSHLARSADAGWAARALTRGTLLSKGWRTEEPQSGSEKKSLFHVRPLGWSLQDNARTVRVGYGRRIRRMPLGVNARQKTGFLSGVQAVGNERGSYARGCTVPRVSRHYGTRNGPVPKCSQALAGGSAAARVQGQSKKLYANKVSGKSIGWFRRGR